VKVESGFTLGSLAALLDPASLSEAASAINALAGLLAQDRRIVVTIDVRVDGEETMS
jgi:hypothetical protein